MLTATLKGQLGDTQFDLRFDAPAGVTALFGPSGAGKTTAINAIAGLWRPAAGRIALDGQVWFDSAAGVWVPARRRKIGYVFQDARLFPHMTVRKNLEYGGVHDAARLIDLLDLAALLDRRPTGLSGGERQRVAIGRALMRGPDLVLMDEPLAALDTARKVEILPYLERLRDEMAVPVLYVSHAMTEVARLAATVVLIDAGRVVDAGAINDVLCNPANAQLIGRREAGAVLNTTVTAFDPATDLTTLSFDGGQLRLVGQVGQLGQRQSIRVPAQDVILSRRLPVEVSALNALPVRVAAITPDAQGSVTVRLALGNTQLLALITAHSAADMGLDQGQDIFAIVKATAVAPLVQS